MRMIVFIFLCGCTGQTLLLPTYSKSSKGAVFAKSIPIFRNTGNAKNLKYTFSGGGYNVQFSCDEIDNEATTAALHRGLQGDINEVGSLIFKIGATAVTGGVLKAVPGAVQ